MKEIGYLIYTHARHKFSTTAECIPHIVPARLVVLLLAAARAARAPHLRTLLHALIASPRYTVSALAWLDDADVS